ncbi:hypothetical protein D9M72_568160 [compost metagenome]
MLRALGLEELDDRRARGADAGDHDPDLGKLLVHHAEGVDQGSQGDDGRAVLVVVEDRDVQFLAEALFDLEAARGGDVFKVDAAVDGGHGLGDHNDFFSVLGVKADRPGVNVGELLEQSGFAFHDGQGRGRANVAQAKDGRAVGQDCDGVALDCQVAGR